MYENSMDLQSKNKPSVVVVGGGLAGLSAALKLESYGYHPLLLEANETLGGRLQTTHHNGFLLDAGFQVLLSNYPEISFACKRALKLKSFRSGAYYRMEDKWALFSPTSFWRWEKDCSRGLFTLGKTLATSSWKKTEGDTDTLIHEMGAPELWVDDFLAPFLRGVFLDKHLEVNSSRFLKLLPLFIWGRACLPAGGMGALPRWFERQLQTTEIRFNSPVAEATPHQVTLWDGQKITADVVLLALSQPELAKLVPSLPAVESRTTGCDYFEIDAEHIHATPYLWLDGRVESPVNNFAILSAVQPTYAPKGKHLLSATTLGTHLPSTSTVQKYLAEELKINPTLLKPMERQFISHALPSQAEIPPLKTRELDGLFIAGEAVDPPSINDAIASGKKAAKAILNRLELVS